MDEYTQLYNLLKNATDRLKEIGRKNPIGGEAAQKEEENLAVCPPIAKPLGKSDKPTPLTVDLNEVLPNPYNRTIDREKVENIKRAILTTAEIKPLVVTQVDKGGKPALMVTDGHHRYYALKELGHKTAPAVYADERGVHTADTAPKGEVVKLADGKFALIKKMKPNPAAEAETAKINENKKEWDGKPHDFKSAEWTHPNGHPRCIRCGSEQMIGDKCDMPREWYDKKLKEEPPIMLSADYDYKRHWSQVKTKDEMDKAAKGEPELVSLERDKEGRLKRAYYRVKTGSNTEELFSVDIMDEETEKVTGAHEGREPGYSITALSEDPKRGKKTQDLTGGAGGAHGGQGFNIPGGGPYRT